MRYLAGFVFVVLAASPLSVSAQDAEEGTTAEPNAEEPAPPSETTPEEPALQLKLDDAGVEVAVGYPPRAADGYTVEEMESRVRAARGGLIAAAAVTVVGGILIAAGAAYDPDPGAIDVRGQLMKISGGVVAALGVIGMAASGAALGDRKRELRELEAAHRGKPPRVQWDLARSRLVF